MPTTDAKLLLQLFEAELSHVRFPDVDRDVLVQALADLDAATADVATAEARVQTARSVAAEKHDALKKLSLRAIAYARVYADGSPELAAKLDALTGGERATAPRKRGRPRKSAVEQVALPEAAQ